MFSMRDQCEVIRSGVLCPPFAVIISRSHHPTNFKPGNILLLSFDLDSVFVHELFEQSTALYNFPKAVSGPDLLPFHPVRSDPIMSRDVIHLAQ